MSRSDGVRLAELLRLWHGRYDPSSAESWDAVGLVCGDPDEDVSRVLFAVDPVDVVVDEALSSGADLLVTHHPLFLAGVHGVAANDPKGRLVHRLVRGGCALLTAHTNADVAAPGVSDALAGVLGVGELVPLQRNDAPPLDKVVVFVPPDDVEAVADAMADAGAGQLGDYDRCSYLTDGEGRFRPLPGAMPAVGQVGQLTSVVERRLEMLVPRQRRVEVVRALVAAHPYQEPAYDVIELAPRPASTGLGRVGRLPASTSLGEFAAVVAAALPATAHGVRVAGDLHAMVNRVAVCGGAGDSLLDAADAAGADVFVTSDLRHHRALEHLARGGCAIIDVAHWAGEWPWLPQAAALLTQDLAAVGATVDIEVSRTPTDPWTQQLRSIR
ncbi:MAG: Nif3-like dinuclear metal center hexameric protein [Actinomycetota bacterium]|nr:MAG: Nif3-like dinuclear metal center hexameric protein [Actinomycetota bacterium]